MKPTPLQRLHNRLERYCSRKVGAWMMARQNNQPEPKLGVWFIVASRLEFRLRNYLYPRSK